MSDCYILGIGGTGSKVIENYIHLCSAGLGPDNLWLGIIDQDEPNGNVAKAKTNLENYQELRKFLKSQGNDNIGHNTNLLKTDIKTSKDDVCWCPLPGTSPTLKEVFRYSLLDEKLQDMMSILYHTKDELDLPLDAGFRGRPSIGAAAIISQMKEQDPFWERLFQGLDRAKEGHKIRIFIISSIFGGTGAAGFPSIARMIRSVLKEKNITSNVHIGGMLMLPYFSFPQPDANEERQVAYADTFLEQTRGALDYYNRVFEIEEEKTFDHLYIAGWDPMIKLNYFEKGGNKQKNPPLIPELYACLSASKFFLEDNIEKQSIFHIARDNQNQFLWSDLPGITKNKYDVKDQIAQLIRMAVAFREIYFPFLDNKWTSIKSEHWFKNLITKHGVDLSDTQTKEKIINLKKYFETYLEWIATMIFNSKSHASEEIQLLDPTVFAKLNIDSLNGETTLNDHLSEHQLKLFDSFIHNCNSNSLKKVFLELNYSKKNKNRSGFGVFLGALYDSCRTLNQKEKNG